MRSNNIQSRSGSRRLAGKGESISFFHSLDSSFHLHHLRSEFFVLVMIVWCLSSTVMFCITQLCSSVPSYEFLNVHLLVQRGHTHLSSQGKEFFEDGSVCFHSSLAFVGATLDTHHLGEQGEVTPDDEGPPLGTPYKFFPFFGLFISFAAIT